MKNKVIYSIALVLGAIFLFSTIFLVRSTRPFNQARKEAIEIAEKYADLEEVTDFYIFNREKTYYTLWGTDAGNEEIVVIIPQDGKKVSVFNQKDGYNQTAVVDEVKKQFKPKKVFKTNLGMYDNQPTWEVTCENDEGKLCYYLLDFKTGEVVNTIENI